MSGFAYTALHAIDQTPPKDNDVVAGWTAFAGFIILIIAVALLCWSMVRQFRKVEVNRKAGVFGEEAAREGEAADSASSDEAVEADEKSDTASGSEM